MLKKEYYSVLRAFLYKGIPASALVMDQEQYKEQQIVGDHAGPGGNQTEA